jgi:hypothetical protein
VARTDDIDAVLAGLPMDAPTFDFALKDDGSLPLDGAAPSIIDRRGKARSMAGIADLGARLRLFRLEHPDPTSIAELYRELEIDRPPEIKQGSAPR